jgi:hypothetical protein
MIGKITIGDLWAPIEGAENVYIGRGTKNPSPLHNPVPITGRRTRDEACDYFDSYVKRELKKGNKVIRAELQRIAKMVMEGKHVHLQCYCKGKRCHGMTIKKIIDTAIAKRLVFPANSN